MSISRAVERAIERETAIAFFLSTPAMESDWVNLELRLAIDRAKEMGEWDFLLPVFLESPQALIDTYPILREWLIESGRPDRLWERTSHQNAISESVALSMYGLMGLDDAPSVAIVLDQRGSGRRTGLPPTKFPDDLEVVPTLIFRPNCQARGKKEVVSGRPWSELAMGFRRAWDRALGGRASSLTLHLLGQSQLALPFLFGHFFDRTTAVKLVTYDRRRGGPEFSIDWNLYDRAPGDGREYCQENDEEERFLKEGKPRFQLVPGEPYPEVALLLVSANQVVSALRHVDSGPEPVQPVWVAVDKYGESVDSPSGWTLTQKTLVEQLIPDVVALLRRLYREHGTEGVQLYTIMPFGAQAILAGLLRHVVGKIKFLEYRDDAGVNSDRDRYASLDIPID